MASLRMAEPAEVAGRWNVTRGGTTCTVTLRIERMEGANAHGLDGATCLTAMVGGIVAGWRPAPVGIALAAADGLKLAMFADQGDGRTVATLPGGDVTLGRLPY